MCLIPCQSKCWLLLTPLEVPTKVSQLSLVNNTEAASLLREAELPVVWVCQLRVAVHIAGAASLLWEVTLQVRLCSLLREVWPVLGTPYLLREVR